MLEAFGQNSVKEEAGHSRPGASAEWEAERVAEAFPRSMAFL